MFSGTESRHTICGFRSFAILCCLGSIAIFGSCERFETREVLATVLAVDGKATVVHEGNATVVARLSLLAAGDQLRTEPGGKATISLVPGARVVLNGQSELEVEELQVHKLGAVGPHAVRARNAWVRLLRGSICASVVKAEVQPHIGFYVDTPAGTIEGSPESIFYVRVNETLTHVLCAGGGVNLMHDEGQNPETLSAGYAQEWQNERPTGSARQVVGDITLAQELQHVLAAAHASEELEDARRQIMPGLDPSVTQSKN